jgi:MFS family permease
MTHPADAGTAGVLRRRTRDATLYACGGLSAMAMAGAAPALPDLSRHFADLPDIDLLARLVVSMPTLLLALAGPVVGVLADQIGRKPILLFGAALYAVAGGLPVLLDDLYAILASRAALGLAMGILFTLPPTLFADYYTDIPTRRRMIGRYAGATATGGVIFVLLGGVAADFHWRTPFALHLVVLLLLPSLLATVTEPDRSGEAIARQANGAAPARTNWPAVIAIYLMVAATGGIFLQMPLNLPFLLVDIGVTQASIAGYAIAWPLVLMAIGGPLYPHIRARLANPWIYSFIAGGLATGYVLLAHADSLALVAFALFAFGVGMGPMYPNSSTWLFGLSEPRHRARILGGLTMAIYLGQFVLPFVAQPVIRAAGIRASFLVLVAGLVALAVAAPLAAWLARRWSSRQPS